MHEKLLANVSFNEKHAGEWFLWRKCGIYDFQWHAITNL